MIINKNLEEEFNLAPIEEHEENTEETSLIPIESEEIQISKPLDKISRALPQVEGLVSSDQDFDEVATEAMKAFKDLLELSMNVEERFMGEIASAASNLLSTALNAKTNKTKKKLEMVKLQIRKQEADQKAPPNLEDTPEIEGGSEVVDRNELLRRCKESKTIEKT